MGLKITRQELMLAAIFGMAGIIFSNRGWLLFLNGLNPIWGFLAYYSIVLVCIFILSRLGLVLFDHKIENILQIIGTILIFFSFFLIFNWTNPYIQYVTQGHIDGASNIYVNNSEDGLTWYLWSFLTPNVVFLRFLTYMFTPFVLTLIGGLLIEEKISLSP